MEPKENEEGKDTTSTCQAIQSLCWFINLPPLPAKSQERKEEKVKV